MKEVEYDIVAIGGGTAGLVSAAGGAYLGVRAAVIERAKLGGDCLWTGCVPSKALIASARLAHAMRHAERLGLESSSPKHAFATVMQRMRSARGVVEHHDDPDRFRGMGVDVHFGTARFESPDSIDVEGVGRIRSKRFVIATGALPVPPPIPGLAEAGYLDHHTVFDADELPHRIAVLGAGPVGLEMAQVFARLGASVVVVEMLPRILPREDADIAERLRSLMECEGIQFRLGERATAVELEGPAKVLVTAGGDRQALHEVIRQASRAVGEAMERGADNDLLDRLAGHDSFAAVDRAALEAELDPAGYVGRCPAQVEEFIRGPLAALLGSVETFTVEKAEVMV